MIKIDRILTPEEGLQLLKMNDFPCDGGGILMGGDYYDLTAGKCEIIKSVPIMKIIADTRMIVSMRKGK